MKIITYTIFFIFITFSINNLTFADSSIVKIKNKIQSSEKKLIDGIWGSNDCSHISTKSLTGLAKYKKCKIAAEHAFVQHNTQFLMLCYIYVY